MMLSFSSVTVEFLLQALAKGDFEEGEPFISFMHGLLSQFMADQ